MSKFTRILHLLFVDDVLIISKVNITEWKVITRLINSFCRAFGMTVNQQKSSIHGEGIPDGELNSFKAILPYTFNELSVGF